ncbi:protein shisa-5 isoform X9 [Teleopsis dalmanni]|uniref:protein shisa-5 isoform X9 n=1 Tax=Teleopsis dalmanni TaxID=139649 RepID=UPI0018CF93D5|nr:protein shisa-5 isoform X9 [Teleopsis dalmanni]XP_037954112.1 protein shisa-5 isoform X9 [Teleopsis dalmanni]
MDIWGIFMFCLLVFLIMSCCGYCCSSKRRGTILSTPVVVTSATHTAPGGYPVTQMPPPGGYQTNVTVAPYPTHQQPHMQMQMPMPMPMPGMQPSGGMQPHMAPYPPMGAQSSAMNPPSYDVAVAGVGAGYPNQSAYEKQAPYNPSFTAQ